MNERGSTSGAVPRREDLSRDEFETEFVGAARPVVLPGLVQRWAAISWNPARLAEHWPRRGVRTFEFPASEGADVRELQELELPFDQLVKRVAPAPVSTAARSPHVYFMVNREMPELLSDMPTPTVVPQGRQVEHWIAMGRDTLAGCHYHMRTHSLLCQIHGRKRVILYPPSDTPSLYPHPFYRRYYSWSRVSYSSPDFSKFPRYRAVRPMEAEIGPGDAILIPVHWWHVVRGTGPTISASLFIQARFREHRFPHPGLHNLAGMLLWEPRPLLQSVVQRCLGALG